MKNPNICRWTMFAIIIIGFVVSGMSAVLFGVEPVPPMFVVGAIIFFWWYRIWSYNGSLSFVQTPTEFKRALDRVLPTLW